MRHKYSRMPLSVLKMHILLFMAIGFTCLTTGCSPMNAMQEQQVAMQKRVDTNTEMLTALIVQMELQQQDAAVALQAVHDEQCSLSDNQVALEESVKQVSRDTEERTHQVQTLSEEMNSFAITFDNKHLFLAARYDHLSDKQESLEETISSLQESSESLHATVVSLRSEEIEALTLSCQSMQQSLQDMKELTESYAQELQTLTATMEQNPTALSRPIEITVEQLATHIEDMRLHQTQTEKAIYEQQDELQRKIQELQETYSQWQESLTSQQQMIVQEE